MQLPFVRRLCEAMRLPILEVLSYEADDVIGTLALQASKHNLDVLIVTNDKDMMQLVGGNVRVLRPGAGGAKSDLIVDAAKVEELMGVPPGKSGRLHGPDGRLHRQHSRRQGYRRKRRGELIGRFGSVENALDHADEVSKASATAKLCSNSANKC